MNAVLFYQINRLLVVLLKMLDHLITSLDFFISRRYWDLRALLSEQRRPQSTGKPMERENFQNSCF